MSTLVVIGYENEAKAQQVRATLLELEREYLIDLEDAVVVVRNEKGKIALKQLNHLTAAGAATGAFWGALLGLLFLMPLVGAAAGAVGGALGGALNDVGIDDDFMRALAETLAPGTAALCVLVRSVTADKVIDEIKPYGGTVLETSLTHDDEARLQAALSAARAAEAPSAT